MLKKVVTYFDKLEDRIRYRLSRKPIIYAIIGAVGVALLWKGVDDIALQFGVNGPFALGLGLVMMLATGLLVSFFIGDGIIISGLNKEKKLVDKTELEIVEEQAKMDKIARELRHIERDLEDLKKKADGPHIHL